MTATMEASVPRELRAVQRGAALLARAWRVYRLEASVTIEAMQRTLRAARVARMVRMVRT